MTDIYQATAGSPTSQVPFDSSTHEVNSTLPASPPAVGARRWSISEAFMGRDWQLIAWRYLVRSSREPMILMFTLLQPLMFVILFRVVFAAAIKVPPIFSNDVMNYLLPGIVAQSCAFSSLGTAVGLAEDMSSGMIDRIRSTPTARSAVLIGRLASDFITYVALVIIMIVAGYISGFHFLNGLWPAVAMCGLAVAFGLAMSCVSAFIGMQIRRPESVVSAGLVVLFPLTFISSAFVPTSGMPGWIKPFANNNPVTYVVAAMRSLANGGPVAAHMTVAGLLLIALVAVFGPLAVLAYQRA